MANNLRDMMNFFIAQRKKSLGSYINGDDYSDQNQQQAALPSQVDNSPVADSGVTNPVGFREGMGLPDNSDTNGGGSQNPDNMGINSDSRNVGINQNVGINSSSPANPMPRSALSYVPADSTVMRRYLMGRQGVFTTETSNPDQQTDVMVSPTAITSRYTSAGDNTVTTQGDSMSSTPGGMPSTGTTPNSQPSAGMNFDYLNNAVRDLYNQVNTQPQFNKEPDANPAQFKRAHWKDILYGMAANLKNANPALLSTPGGFLGALVGGAGGGAITKTPVSNPDYQTPTNLGLYGQALYNRAQQGVDYRNQGRYQNYHIGSQAHDKKVQELTGVVRAGESVVNAQATQEYKRALEEQRADQENIRRSNLQLQQTRETRLAKAAEDRETARQYLRDHPKTTPVKVKINGVNVMGAYNPTAPEGQNITPVKDKNGNYIEAPDDALQIYEAKAQAAAQAANVPMPHAEELLTQAEQEVQQMKDYRDLNEDEIQRRVTSIYNAKLKDAETQYKAQQGQADRKSTPLN